MNCELCILDRITNVYFDNRFLIIMDCDSCLVPMVVWREHTMEIPEPDEEIMESLLKLCARNFYGNQDFFIDKNQRAIPDHLHWHARKK